MSNNREEGFLSYCSMPEIMPDYQTGDFSYGVNLPSNISGQPGPRLFPWFRRKFSMLKLITIWRFFLDFGGKLFSALIYLLYSTMVLMMEQFQCLYAMAICCHHSILYSATQTASLALTSTKLWKPWTQGRTTSVPTQLRLRSRFR
jgi:hypothetical protein